MASQGLVSTAGSASMRRAPGFSSRMKQSCRLSKRACLGVAQVEVGEQPPHRDRQPRQPRAADAAEPAHRMRQRDARHAVGQQEVQVLVLQQPVAQAARLSSACQLAAVHLGRTVTEPPHERNLRLFRPGAGRGRWRCCRWPSAAARAVAGQAPVADRPFAHGHARRGAGCPAIAYDEERFFASDGAPPAVVAQRRAALAAPGAALRRALRALAGAERRGARRPAGPAVHRQLPRAVPVQRAAAPAPEGRQLRAVGAGRDARPTWTATSSTT